MERKTFIEKPLVKLYYWSDKFTTGKCLICLHQFNNKLELENHIIEKHNEYTYKCPICYKNYINKQALNKCCKVLRNNK